MKKNIVMKYLQREEFTIICKEILQKECTNKEVIDSLCDVSPIKDVNGIVLYESKINGGVFAICLFLDENDNLRIVELMDNLIFAYVEYFNLHEKIKADLIDSINMQYGSERVIRKFEEERYF